MAKYRNTASIFDPDELPERDPDYSPCVIRRDTYVPATVEPKQLPVQAYPSTAPQWPVTVDTPAAQSVTTGSHLDRARGFNLTTSRLALTTGILAGVGAVALAGVPLLSFTLLMWVTTAYFAVWLVAWLVHSLLSAEGIAFMAMWRGFGYLRNEQKHRHELERHFNGIDRKGKGRR